MVKGFDKMAQVKKEETSVSTNKYREDLNWNIYMAQMTAIEKAKYEAANDDDELVGYHGLRLSDL